jgi:hypothetical protein
MKIEILGTGCYNCIKLETLVNEVLHELRKTGVEIVRVDNERQIRRIMPVDEIPGLVIDGTLLSTRKVPDKESLFTWLSAVGQTDQ